MKSLLFTATLSLRKRSERLLIKFAILLQVRLTHAQTFFRGVTSWALLSEACEKHAVGNLAYRIDSRCFQFTGWKLPIVNWVGEYVLSVWLPRYKLWVFKRMVGSFGLVALKPRP